MTLEKNRSDKEIEQLYQSGDLRLTQERNDFLLPQIIDFVQQRRWINLRPEYQRRLVWDKKKKSRFVESLLMNVPVPPVFLYEYDLSRYEVMDGQQRLNAIIEFYSNKLTLTGLETWSALNGRCRSQCPPIIQRGLDRRRLSATVLIAEVKASESVPFDVRREVFERLNTGGQQLNAHELRNALYPGTFNGMLIRLASASLFRRLWDIPPAGAALLENALYRRMQDCELVLRFFAFRHTQNIKGSVRSILDACMAENAAISPSDDHNLRTRFLSRLNLSNALFGSETFRLDEGEGRPKLSMPLYDAVMVAVDRLWENRTALRRRKHAIAARLRKQLKKPRTYELVVGRPNTSQAIKDRIDLVERLMKQEL